MAFKRVTVYSDARREFLALYPNRKQAILRPPGCKTWVSVSKHWPLPNEQIEKAIALETPDAVWGCRWGDETRFAVFDIDAGSKYHTAEELRKLTKGLETIRLISTVYRSSESGGWHVYLFFEKWQDCTEVQRTLKAWLAANGYEIRNGILEVFPSGNGLRLPLQSGFAWLNASGEVLQERGVLSVEQAVSLFVSDLNVRASDWEVANTLIESQLSSFDRARRGAGEHKKAIDTEGFDGLWNYKLIPEKYQDGRKYWQTGLTANGERHDAILAVEHYLWHGDPEAGVPALPGEWNDDGRFRLLLAWLKEKHNGFCNHINQGRWHKVEAQIERAVKWRRPSGTLQVVEAYPMTERLIERLVDLSRGTGRIWSTEDLKKGNDGREQQARAKITAALEQLVRQGAQITRNELARLSGCSPNTVSKHRDIWLLLASGSGDLNPFAGSHSLVFDLPEKTLENIPSFPENLLHLPLDSQTNELVVPTLAAICSDQACVFDTWRIFKPWKKQATQRGFDKVSQTRGPPMRL